MIASQVLRSGPQGVKRCQGNTRLVETDRREGCAVMTGILFTLAAWAVAGCVVLLTVLTGLV